MSKENQLALNSLCEFWQADSLSAFSLLARCEVEVTSDASLERMFAHLSNAYFFDDVSDVRARMDQWLRDHLTHRASTTDFRKSLKADYDLRPKDYCLNYTAQEKIEHATASYLNDVHGLKPKITIPRTKESSQLTEWLQNETKDILIVTGTAGSGKSFFLADAVEQLSLSNPVLAFRLDQQLEHQNLEQVGNDLLEISDNPVTVLKLTYPGKKPVLVIDQLDAVSDSSGRRQSSKKVALDLIRSALRLSGFKIVLACRSYDLANDTDFSNIVSRPSSDRIDLPGFEWSKDILPVLRSHGYSVKEFSIKQQKLLETPVNLATYLRLIGNNDQSFDFSNANDLVEKLIERSNSEIREKGEHWSVWEPLRDVAHYMSEHRTLEAPVSLLDAYRNGKNLLYSSGLFAMRGLSLQFAHESYFDFAFARTFVGAGHSLIDWLKASEQHLFRRTQVRQIMSFMREQSSRAYVAELKSILDDPGVRFFLKDSVSRWLAEIGDPTDEELSILLGLTSVYSEKLRWVVFHGTGWASLLAKKPLMTEWLLSSAQQTRRNALNICHANLRKIPEEISAALRAALDEKVDFIEEYYRTYSWAAVENRPELVAQFETELVNLLPDSYFDGRVNRLAPSHWDKANARYGIDVLEAMLRRCLDANPESEPFFGEKFRDGEVNHHAKEFAQSDPVYFLDAIGPLFCEAIIRRQDQTEFGIFDDGWMFGDRHDRETMWRGVIMGCMRETAKLEPTGVRRFAERFLPVLATIGLNYVLQCIKAAPKACADLFEVAVRQPHLFEVGKSEVEPVLAAEAAIAAKPYVPKNGWEEFETRLFRHYPEHRLVLKSIQTSDGQTVWPPNADPWRRYYYARNGYERWLMLRVIGPDNISTKWKPECDVLMRKFALEPVPKAKTIEAGFAKSPIPMKSAKLMSDEAWLSAMEHYHYDDCWQHRKEPLTGGAVQLADTLQKVAEADLERFASLMDQIPDDCHSAYPAALLDAFSAAKKNDPSILAAVKSSLRFDHQRVRTALVCLVRGRPELGINTEIWNALVNIATQGEAPHRDDELPDEQLAESITADDIFGTGKNTLIRGVTADRRTAWEAIASIAWSVPERTEDVKALVARQFKVENTMDVFPAIVSAAGNLLNQERRFALKTIKAFAQKDIRVVANHYVMPTYNWALWKHADEFSFLLEAMRESGHGNLDALADFWEAARVMSGDMSEVFFKKRMALFEQTRKCMAVVCHQYLDDVAHSDKALQTLLHLSGDYSEEVREQVFSSNWDSILKAGKKQLELAWAYLESPDFLKPHNNLIFSISRIPDKHPELTMAICKRLIEHVETNDDAEKYDSFGLGTSNVGNMLLSVYEVMEGKPEIRGEALSYLDDFLARGVHDAYSAVQRYDRL